VLCWVGMQLGMADADSELTPAQLQLELVLTRRLLHAHEAAMRLYLSRGDGDQAGEEELEVERAREKIDEIVRRLRRQQ
jgi:hypothetical protein